MFTRNPTFVHSELGKIISISKQKRLTWFNQLTIKHPHLITALDELLDYVQRGENTRFIFLIGMTGAGKTHLAENALSDAFNELWGKRR